MQQYKPLFSIITVTWNAAQVIEPTLRSVVSQSFTNYEYIVMDGASTDDTLARVRAAAISGLRLFSEPDEGLYDAMNKAIDRAEGQYLIFLNAGDTFTQPTTLASIASHAQGNPGVIYGQTQTVDAQRKVVGKRHLTAPAVLTAESFRHGMLVCHQAFVARRDIAPHYDRTYKISADFDWCIRVLQQSQHNAYVGDAPIINFLADGLSTQRLRSSLRERFAIMCHYYGFVPTALRHFSFLLRFIKRKLATRKRLHEIG